MTDAKLFLLQVKLYDTKINAKLEELQHLKDLVTKITPTLKESPGGGSGSLDKFENAIAKIVDLENEINEAVDGYVDRKQEVSKMIDLINDPDQYNVIHARYFQNKTFEEIACEMHMTYRNVCYIHGRALSSIELKMKEKGVEV